MSHHATTWPDVAIVLAMFLFLGWIAWLYWGRD